jgi:hypothetical protein
MKQRGIVIFCKDAPSIVIHFFDEMEITDELVRSIASEHSRTPIHWAYLDGPEHIRYMHFLQYKDGRVEVDKQTILDNTIHSIRHFRDSILASLDTQFIIATEKNDDYNIQRIKTIKQFYRDLPAHLAFLNVLSLEQLENINPFGNIVWVKMIDGGTGYRRPPKITLPAPTHGHETYAAYASARLEGDSVAEISILGFNCGYEQGFIDVMIEPPENGGKIAKAKAEVIGPP